MITGIAIENFKGIRERVTLDLRPITLLFGANSAGKSTFLHALHYAREIFERHNLNADETISGGSYIDLGGFEGFVHGRDRSQSVKLRIDIALDQHGFPSFDADFDSMGEILDLQFDSLVKAAQTAAVELTVQWSNLEECPFVSSTKVFIDKQLFAEITAQPNLRGVVVSKLVMDHPSLLTVGDTRREEEVQPEMFDGESVLSAAMTFCGGCIAPGDGQRIELSGRGDALPAVDDRLEFDLEAFSPSGNEDEDERLANQLNLAHDLVVAVSDLIIGPCQLIRDYLKQFRYLGPLRETPPRNYQPPRYADPARWSSGLGAWDVLQHGTDEFVEKVGGWLGDDDKLNSGYRIERRSFKEVDLSDPLIVKLLTGRAFDEADEDSRVDLTNSTTQTRIVVTPNETELELRPHDVGIGISQVVPVVATALDGKHRLLAIEQPELHLHPKLQAELADLFIEAALGDSKHVVILETHSELIPLRLMRRIREARDDEGKTTRPSITSKDVAIVYIETHEGATVTTPLELGSDGQLLDPWPDGFFEEGFRERFSE